MKRPAVLLLLLLPALALADPWAIGPKSVLVLRVDFSDLQDTRPASDFIELMNQVDTAFQSDSYGKVDFTTTVTPFLRLPSTASTYAANPDWSGIRTDALAVAVAAGYDPESYDRVITHWRSLASLPGSTMTWSGFGQIGGRYVWLNGWWNFKGISHELGHTFGAEHASRIQDGKNVDRGDPFDVMGWGNITPQSDFHPFFKRQFGWITGDQIQLAGPGTYRVFRFDHKDATGLFAIQVGNVLACYRRAFTSNSYLSNGAQIVKIRDLAPKEITQLDMTPTTSSSVDAALPIDNTYTEPSTGLSIKVIGQGGTTPREYLDIQVF